MICYAFIYENIFDWTIIHEENRFDESRSNSYKKQIACLLLYGFKYSYVISSALLCD